MPTGSFFGGTFASLKDFVVKIFSFKRGQASLIIDWITSPARVKPNIAVI
jgi:hypothetical protein